MTEDETVAALFALWWAGRVGNDLFAPARWWHRHKGDEHLWPVRAATEVAGRWQSLPEHEITLGAATAVADTLLERYGVVCKAMLRADRRDIRWAPVYAELKRREWRGEVVRGRFVDGLDGAQFAQGRTIDLLRDGDFDPAPRVLAGADPANVWGRLVRPDGLPPGWKARPAGSLVITVAGTPAAYASRWGRYVWPVGAADPSDIAAGLATLAGWRGRPVRIERWAGAPAIGGEAEPALRSAGAHRRGAALAVPA